MISVVFEKFGGLVTIMEGDGYGLTGLYAKQVCFLILFRLERLPFKKLLK